MYCLIQIENKQITELFSHVCPEPIYDMLRKYLDINPIGKFEIMEKC